MSKVKLISNDDEEIDVPKCVAEVSVTIRNMLDDIGDIKTPIPLPNVSGDVLKKVVEYCTHHVENPTLVAEANSQTNEMLPWDKKFCQVDKSLIFELILAANYLDIKPLLDLMCKVVLNMIKDKSPKEIRTMFNIKNDFTPEEEAEARKEYEWCVERSKKV